MCIFGGLEPHLSLIRSAVPGSDSKKIHLVKNIIFLCILHGLFLFVLSITSAGIAFSWNYLKLLF